LSLASAYSGALNLQEAAKIAAIGLQAAEFRHGPLEMAGPGLTVFIFAGEKDTDDQQKTYGLNYKLWKELRALKTNAWLLEPSSNRASLPKSGEDTITIPHATGIGMPLGEIIPIQLLCVLLSKLRGFEPGKFRHIGKVTTIE
jgi:glucosamine--fructose-6-phosphate aminotransferase (isomerizing)